MDELAYRVRDVGPDPRERAALTAALVSLAPRQWPILADRLRAAWPWQVEPELTDEFRALIASVLADGFVRERAVAYFAGRPSALGACVLALRAADWVHAVRERARAAYAVLLGGPAEIWLPSADLVFGLEQRHEGRWLPPRVREALAEVPVAALTAAGQRSRRIAYATRIERGRLSRDELLTAVRDHPDGQVRALAVAAVEPADLLGLAVNRSVHVRRSVLARTGDVALATAALTDRNSGVRQTAQTILRGAGEDPAARYRRLLGPDPRTAVLRGLAETGGAADAGLLVAYLTHRRAALRSAAVRALRQLDAGRVDDFLALLTDSEPAVVRQATRALLRHAPELSPALLRDLLGDRRPPHVRLAGYRLEAARGTWPALLVALRTADDPALGPKARRDVVDWLDRWAASAYLPAGKPVEGTAELLDGAERWLGPERTRLLRFHARLGKAEPPPVRVSFRSRSLRWIRCISRRSA